jgi:outer membrane protein, heavy metal efflux system
MMPVSDHFRLRVAISCAVGLGVVPKLPAGGAPALLAQAPSQGGAVAISGSLSLAQLLSAATLRSPAIEVARARVDSARGERAIAGGLPNPALQVIPNTPFQYSVGLALDAGPQRVYRTRSASLGTSAARFDLADVTRTVTFAVRAAYFDLLLADSLRAIARADRDALRQIVAADSARVRAGDAPSRDLARSRLELAHAEATLADRGSVSRSARTQLQLLIGEAHPDTAFEVSGSLEYAEVHVQESALITVANANRPDVAAAEERVKAGEASRALARSALVPVPGVALVYQPRAPFGTGSRFAPAITLSVPLLYSYSGERGRAAAGLRQALTAESLTRAQAEGDVALALADFHSARERIGRYEHGLLADATAARDAIQYAYQAGAASLLELLDALRAYSETRADYYTAVHDYWVSAYALNRAAGKDVVAR